MINVLIVEDSPVVQQLLVRILGSDPDIRVAGITSSGEEALGLLNFHKPDIVTMDLHLPGMDGLEATRRIMESTPLPIVIVSASWNPMDVEKTFEAMRAGALTAVEKPLGLGNPKYAAMAAKLVQTVKLMAEVKVVRRTPRIAAAPVAAPPFPATRVSLAAAVRVVAIGASTGGPSALHTILSRLPRPFAVPLLIVQHIAEGFAPGMADWLEKNTGCPVHVAVNGDSPEPGHAYLAPDSCHMGVANDGRIVLSEAPPEHSARPSVSHLFRSVAAVFGNAAVGVLLSGMGSDGAKELRLMKDTGAVTIAQDRESSVVHGMPGEAIALDAASVVLPPAGIADLLWRLVAGNTKEEGRADARGH